MQPAPEYLIDGIQKGDTALLARALTLVESTKKADRDKAHSIVECCLSNDIKSTRIGITGAPGVGKSTFIEAFGELLTKQGKKVAVLAVDPTSSISKGSILGDKTRMPELAKNPRAFIRPSPSGESLGGVARKTRESILLCEAAGFDIILIETVGVGQSEIAVHSMVDFFLLLKIAGAGDELQGIKRGIIEMADAIVINKTDGTNIKPATQARSQFEQALHLYPPKKNGWVPKVLNCSSLTGEGIADVWNLIREYILKNKRIGHLQANRKEQNKNWLLQAVDDLLKTGFYSHPGVQKRLKKMTAEVQANLKSPFMAAEELLAYYATQKGSNL